MAAERQKLNLGGISKAPKPVDPDALREVGKEHGFESRDPVSIRPAPIAEPEAPHQHLGVQQAVLEPIAPAAVSAASPTRFRRPGRPVSDRMIAVNVRVSQETADFLYQMRDATPRYTLADVIDDLVAHYRDHGPRQTGQ